jgi:hypothetical protein
MSLRHGSIPDIFLTKPHQFNNVNIITVLFLSSELSTDLSSPDIEGIYESQVLSSLPLVVVFCFLFFC